MCMVLKYYLELLNLKENLYLASRHISPLYIQIVLKSNK